MKKPTALKAIAAFSLGLTYPAFGACTVIVSNYTLPSDVSGCFEIYGANVVFDGNYHKVTGSAAQASNTVITVYGWNTTVKNVEVDCNTKLTGIQASNAGPNSKLDQIRVNNCTYGVFNTGTGLNINGRMDGGNNMMNNAIGVVSVDKNANHTYTTYVDAFGNDKPYGVYVMAPYYDYYGLYYFHQTALIASGNTFFWLNYSAYFANKQLDMSLYNIPNAYMSGVRYEKINSVNTNIIKD